MSPKISEQQKEERRKKILDAAKLVFAAKGYEAATFKDILDETGMSRGWIYLYFQTKEEIFEALLDQQDHEYEDHLAALVSGHPLIWDVIRRLTEDQQADLLRGPDGIFLSAFYEYFQGGARNERRRRLLLDRYERGITRYAALLQTGVERGEFRPLLPLAQLARIAASYSEGIMTHSLAVGPELAQTEFQMQALLEYLEHLLKPEASPASE
ncbi:TetR family transcriptional regulator [Paenibacillus sp. MMS20-IR301]|uniref:TetR/AcrR family transcriptional regulator n=1 Tax=Paenibacillus sp. MMS20-IR301 TaxID=2895946 RepID=UPI0028E5BDD9|nr:TetR family transcriptional regulator [Paenibacillus sp. MMS20-IR301]WNS44221.1 TetR family transcriptional regulator [Paenibacillus sp. MMS20-IR301]